MESTHRKPLSTYFPTEKPLSATVVRVRSVVPTRPSAQRMQGVPVPAAAVGYIINFIQQPPFFAASLRIVPFQLVIIIRLCACLLQKSDAAEFLQPSALHRNIYYLLRWAARKKKEPRIKCNYRKAGRKLGRPKNTASTNFNGPARRTGTHTPHRCTAPSATFGGIVHPAVDTQPRPKFFLMIVLSPTCHPLMIFPISLYDLC